MYKKGSKGWFKHGDFLVLDLICLHIAFVLSYVIRHGFINPYRIEVYRSMAIFLTMADIMIIFLFETLKNVLKRGYYKEFAAIVQQTLILELLATLYLFSVQDGFIYSRITLYAMGLIYLLVTYFVRLGWKRLLRKRLKDERTSLIIITTESMAESVVHEIVDYSFERYKLAGIVVIDKNMEGQSVHKIPVVATVRTAADFVCREWVDEALVVMPPRDPLPEQLINQLSETGITVHINVGQLPEFEGKRQFVEKIGRYTVLSTSINYATDKQLLGKRILDIIGGLVGCLITIVLFVFIAPAIKKESPGPVFFTQTRIGKNGRKFKMYKFRSMYMNAEEMKKELMDQNNMKDGMMFKMDFDPRVIGNKILPNGQKKTGIGDFIRRTSLDEFPQFFNVLKGDMSLVGTRPPTLDEWEKYELRHRARLSIKPGITGLWQVSGRSKITDFEEVVKLDKQYITDWSMGLDFRILFKTIQSVIKKDGAK
ncbi:galactosyl transferase [Claveliimonas bilis]|uniref:sugar transferase n=1 Tax=Claveliimonas bilis TaxID=3028070 RepID=UPI001C3BE948|nr:sugar transferase [Claveliimonas bilis]BDZ80126.1 galactosyl transferase [Claveliimonas bilis]BDZ83986.1 galactosyl transferase [Claveliimonas bilis]HIZ60877.1 sugar transferase [Candidatus Dorea faecipullorum]